MPNLIISEEPRFFQTIHDACSKANINKCREYFSKSLVIRLYICQTVNNKMVFQYS